MASECKALRVLTSPDDHVVPVGTLGGRQTVILATGVLKPLHRGGQKSASGTIGMTGGLKSTQEQGSAWGSGHFPASVPT